MRRAWSLLLALAALALSLACGVAAGWAGRVLQRFVRSDEPAARALGVFVAVVLAAFLILTVWKGLRVAARSVLPVVAALTLAVAVIAVATGAGTGRGAVAVLAFVLLTVAIVALSVVARAVAGTAGDLLFVVVAVSGAAVGAVLGGGLAATAIAIGAMLAGRRALRRGGDYPALTRLTTSLAVRGGTSFRDADLSGADLRSARLYACDFRGAKLDGARFDGATVRLCLFDPGRSIAERRPDVRAVTAT